MTKHVLGTLALVLFSSLASAQMQQLNEQEAATVKEAVALALQNSSLNCNSIAMRRFRSTIRASGTTVEVNTASNQPIVVLTWADSSTMAKLIVTSNAEQTLITEIRQEYYNLGRVNSGTITNPSIRDSWVLNTADSLVCRP